MSIGGSIVCMLALTRFFEPDELNTWLGIGGGLSLLASLALLRISLSTYFFSRVVVKILGTELSGCQGGVTISTVSFAVLTQKEQDNQLSLTPRLPKDEGV